MAIGPFLIAGHLAGPTIYDILAWSIVSLFVVRILRTGDERWWLAVGATIGVALLDKETILFLVGALLVGLVVNGQPRVLASRRLWIGAAIAVAIWSPALVWQAAHGWPMLEMSANLRREHSGLEDSLKYVPIQVLLPGWWVAPVWIGGLWTLWREERFRRYRAFAFAYVLLFVVIGVSLGDRPYYLASLYPILLAAGAIVTRDVVDGVRRFFSERPPGRRSVWRSRRAAVLFVVALGVVDLPISVPILPPSALATVPLQKINYNLGEEIGWPELVAEVATVYRSLPPPERDSVVVLTGNYGEAGAIDRYGPADRLPQAYSGHNSDWWWGPPKHRSSEVIAIGFGSSYLARFFHGCRPVARVRNPWGVDNQEEGQPISVCSSQRGPWSRIWPGLKHCN